MLLNICQNVKYWPLSIRQKDLIALCDQVQSQPASASINIYDNNYQKIAYPSGLLTRAPFVHRAASTCFRVVCDIDVKSTDIRFWILSDYISDSVLRITDICTNDNQ